MRYVIQEWHSNKPPSSSKIIYVKAKHNSSVTKEGSAPQLQLKIKKGVTFAWLYQEEEAIPMAIAELIMELTDQRPLKEMLNNPSAVIKRRCHRGSSANRTIEMIIAGDRHRVESIRTTLASHLAS